jgi:hypothetical protein
MVMVLLPDGTHDNITPPPCQMPPAVLGEWYRLRVLVFSSCLWYTHPILSGLYATVTALPAHVLQCLSRRCIERRAWAVL